MVNPIKMLGGEVKRASHKFTSADFADWANSFMDSSLWGPKIAQLIVIRPVPHWVNLASPSRNFSHNDATDGLYAGRSFFKGSLAVLGPVRYGFPLPHGAIDYKGADGTFNTVLLGYSQFDSSEVPFARLIPPVGLIGTTARLPQGPLSRSTLSAHLRNKGARPEDGQEFHMALFHPNQLSRTAQKGIDAFMASAYKIIGSMPISPPGSQGYFLYPQTREEHARIMGFFGAPGWCGTFMLVPLHWFLGGGELGAVPESLGGTFSAIKKDLEAFDGVSISFYRNEYSCVVLRELFEGRATFFPVDRRTLYVQHPDGPAFILAALEDANSRLKAETVPASAYSPLFYSASWAVNHTTALSPHPSEVRK